MQQHQKFDALLVYAVYAVTLAVFIQAGFLTSSQAAFAQSFSTRFVASGFNRPVFLTAPPGDLERVFVVEQHTGAIRILRLSDDSVDSTPFLQLTGLSTGDEQGLLGLAFHPEYETNGFLYVYITETDFDSRILRYQVSDDPDVADPLTRTDILEFDQPQGNHNGGWIGFGPDGLLYVASGDGGGGNDSGIGHTALTGNAQDTTDNLLGKILRLDVDNDDFPADTTRNYAIPSSNPFVGMTGDDEIWAFGLRNPYRSSFDRQTGDFFIADVGQLRCEEINVQLATSIGGENYGWRLREGTIETPTGGVGGDRPPGAIDPIIDYPHSQIGELCSDPGAGFQGAAIVGGYVYRGPIQELVGRYFFADFSTAEIWSLVFDGSNPTSHDGTNYTELTNHTSDSRFTPDVGSFDFISSFGEDDEGNLYVLDLFDGEVFQIPEPTTSILNFVAFATVGLMARRKRSH